MDNINDILDEKFMMKKEKIRLKDKISDFLFNKSACLVEKIIVKRYPKTVAEGYDRTYVLDYIKTCLPFIKGDILEFNGQVTYSHLFDKSCNIMHTSYIGAKEKFPNSDFYIDILDETTLPNYKFDCIVATDFIHYFSNTMLVLDNLKKMLKPNGLLIIATPGPCHVDISSSLAKTFYTTTGLMEVLEENFGKENVFNLKKYGDFASAICALFGLKKSLKIKSSDRITITMGVCCKISGVQ